MQNKMYLFIYRVYKQHKIKLFDTGIYRCTLDENDARYCLIQHAYDTIRYDSVYLTCSKKLTGSQLSLPHGINKKLKCETKNKKMSVIGPVQSHYREAVHSSR